MTLQEFILQQQTIIEHFRQYWIDNNESDEEDFPMEMSEIDWEEQYNAWCEILNG